MQSLPSLLVFVMMVGGLSGCPTTTEKLKLPPLAAVPTVDLSRYLGTWYEIASFPQSFQAGCTATTANYSLRDNGEVEVVNRCMKNAEESVARGRARIVDTTTNAKLEVSFFGPFWGDYWVIDLGPDYEFAVVGNPSRDYLWILSRTAAMAPEVYEGILTRLKQQNYDVSRLTKTPQPTE